MMVSVRKRLLKGVAANGAGQIANLIIQLVSVPVFLHTWGASLYGEWLLLSTIPAYLSMSDLSFATAAGTDMTMRVAADDRSGATAVFRSTWILVSIVSVCLGFIACLFLLVSHWTQWLNFSLLSSREANVAAIFLLGQVLLSQQVGLLWAAYRCSGNYARGVSTATCLRAFEFAALAGVAFAGGSPVWGAISVFTARVLVSTMIWFDVKRRVPWLSLGYQANWFSVVRPLVGPALSFNAFPLGQALSLQGSITLVGAMFGPAAATLFSTTRTLTRLVWQAMNAVANASFVELSSAFGANDLRLARRIHRKSFQASLFLGLPATVVVYLLGPWGYRLWTKGEVVLDPALFGVLCSLSLVGILWGTSYIVPMAANRHQKLAGIYVAAAGLSLVLGYFGGRALGMAGIAWGAIVGEAILAAFVLQLAIPMTADSWQRFWRAIFSLRCFGMGS